MTSVPAGLLVLIFLILVFAFVVVVIRAIVIVRRQPRDKTPPSASPPDRK